MSPVCESVRNRRQRPRYLRLSGGIHWQPGFHLLTSCNPAVGKDEKKFRGSLVKKGRGETILMYWGKSDTPKMLGDPSCWDPSMFPPYHFRSYLLVNLWSCESRRRETVVGPPYRSDVIGCSRALSQKRQPRRCKVRSFAIYFHHSCTTTRRLCSYLVEQFSLSLCFRSY